MRNQMMGAVDCYVQGERVLEEVGPTLARAGYNNVLVLHGRVALSQAGERLAQGLDKVGIAWHPTEYQGFCTEEDIDAAASAAQPDRFDCILGVGGGKLMDFSKAVADKLALPVYLVPTVAATCAACAPLSVIYTPQGTQKTIRFFGRTVHGVWADLTVLSNAPKRYLASGIADTFAKSCEYSSMRPRVTCGDLETGMYMGYSMARAVDETLLSCARKALTENRAHVPGKAFSDAVACVLLFTGTVSSTGGFGGRQNARFKIAHGYNEIIRGQYVKDVRRWLHGEIVAVGILAQLRANGVPKTQYEAVRSLFRDIGMPLTLADLGMDTSEPAVDRFVSHLIEHSHTEEAFTETVRRAILEGVGRS